MAKKTKPLVLPVDGETPEPDVIREAAACLLRGGLVAFPTETVYGLGANAFDPEAVRRIFAAKGRPSSDPLIVHLASSADIPLVASGFPATASRLADAFWPGPLTLLLPRRSSLPPDVTAGRDTVAVRVPAHPVAAALLREAGVPIAAPSANRFGHTSPTQSRHVVDDLGDRVDIVLDAGSTPWGVESTVLDPLQSPPVILRPGGITRGQIESVIGAIRLARPEEHVSDSPGRLPRHYAPTARLILCAGDSPAAIAASIRRRAEEFARRSPRPGILAVSEVCALLGPGERGGEPIDLGSISDLRTVARNLFAGMRELETRGAGVILAHRMPAEGLGEALNDRLTRAAQDPSDGG
jgi:L-threonylcarbamoyladenylate synthase